MKRRNKLRKNLIIIFLSISYIIVILFSWSYYPSYKLWKSIDIIISETFFKISVFRLIHLMIGFPLFIFGMINVIEIININQKAQLRKNVPLYLLKDGYYSKVRHPMYTMIILIQFSLFFSLCSLLGILFSLFFTFLFMIFGLYEEKYQLLPILGEAYKNYSNELKQRFFFYPIKEGLLFLHFFMFIGAFL
ncbi:MAG: hypothetical protein EU549_03265 [Promethearchaeota archaeon]|nr:MAG: hypothetical protein EU549_03265 [Candidatus Lokiarchaeota archaeon]